MNTNTLAGGYEHISGPESADSPLLVDLGTNESLHTADFGYAGRGNISGTVYYDWNESGQQDLGEDGIASAHVCLYADADTNGIPDGRQSGMQGYGCSGQLRVHGLPAGYLSGDSDADPTAGPDHTADVASNVGGDWTVGFGAG